MKKSVSCALALLAMIICVFCVSCDAPKESNSETTNKANVQKEESIPQQETIPESTPEQNSDSAVSPEATSTSVTITETVSGSQADWETSFQKGNECVDKGNIRLATFYYVNALGKAPGNMTVIQKYREVIKNAIDKSTNVEEKYGYYTALESFLQNQISTVEVSKVEQISKWLDELAADRDKLENDAVVDTVPDVDDTADENPFDELIAALNKQEQNVRQSLEKGKNNSAYLDVASYQLQECEQIIRSIITLSSQQGNDKQDLVSKSYGKLKTLSEDVVNQKSKVLWDAFYTEHEKFVNEYNGLSFASDSPTTYGDKEGNMEKRLKLIQKEMAKLQALLPKLSEKYVGDMSIDYSKDKFSSQNASALIQQMQLWLKESSEKQMQLYNKWAVSRIKTANDDAYKATGTFANGKGGREAIAKALIDNLGPIDTRFLTSEVNRCYHEVLDKYLKSNQLNPVKGADSWTEQGNMGHTLLKMFDMSKVQPTQF